VCLETAIRRIVSPILLPISRSTQNQTRRTLKSAENHDNDRAKTSTAAQRRQNLRKAIDARLF
jgi:hypothetical protein